jgi:hypothetical protein
VAFLLEVLQLGIDALHRQPHNIIIAAIEARNTDISYPLLNAIGSSLVEGVVGFYIMMYLIIGEQLEGDIGGDRERALLALSEQAHACGYLMGTAANLAEHTHGIGLILRLAKDIIANDNNSVGCDDKLVGLERRFIGSCLLFGDILGNIRCWNEAG